MRRLVLSLVTVAVMLMPITFGTPSPVVAGGDPVYVALGDSLAVGFHPGRGPTDRGYVDDVWERLHDDFPGLRLKGFGCPGETTRAMITGARSACSYPQGSQLDQAVTFMENRPGETAFVTIDIGGNDLVGRCFDFGTGVLSRACVIEHLPRWQQRIGTIVDALRTAAGPGVPVVGMTYYDPFLGLWGLLPGGHELARTSLRAMRTFDAGLTQAYVDAGAGVADVATTFRIEDFTATDAGVPLNVAITCRWTWFCTPRFLTDVHPTPVGYHKIGRTFARVIRPQLAP